MNIGNPVVANHQDFTFGWISQSSERGIKEFQRRFGKANLFGDDDFRYMPTDHGAGQPGTLNRLQTIRHNRHPIIPAQNIQRIESAINQFRTFGQAFEVDRTEVGG